MTFPIIHTKATNVELNEERKDLIARRLAPLARLLYGQGEIKVDVVLRRTRSRLTGDMYFVSVKLSTPQNSYMAVSAKAHLGRALTTAREMLRKSISRGASVSDYSIRRDRQEHLDAYTLTL